MEEKPIEEKVDEPKIVEETKIVEEVVKENNICLLCGVNYTGMTLEAHEARKFHQEYVWI